MIKMALVFVILWFLFLAGMVGFYHAKPQELMNVGKMILISLIPTSLTVFTIVVIVAIF